MKKTKLLTSNEAKVGYYLVFIHKDKNGESSDKKIPMVKITGNFSRGGFIMTKSKIKAILDNAEELQKFIDGAYDEELQTLGEDEVIEP